MRSTQDTKIILIGNVDSTFVRHDEQILSEMAPVKKLICRQPKRLWAFILEQIKLFVFVWRNIRSSEAVFCWFADYHSFLPAWLAKKFNKPFYLIPGGYDTTYIPELEYGVYTSPIRSKMVDYAYHHASLNLPVSQFLADEIMARYGGSMPVEVLPTGYTVKVNEPLVKEDFVLTVAAVDSAKRLKIKGIDRYIELAREMPEVDFKLVGVDELLLKSYQLPQNLVCIGVIAKAELNVIYQKAKVYGQFSVREGLPNAVLEAMSYACVVVGINHSGITEAVGGAGYLLDTWDVAEAKKVVLQALHDTTSGSLAQQRVAENFNAERRRNRLFELVRQKINN
jgi:glycosyltransferase involved in cell wall biosynthesis